MRQRELSPANINQVVAMLAILAMGFQGAYGCDGALLRGSRIEICMPDLHGIQPGLGHHEGSLGTDPNGTISHSENGVWPAL
jgi:hypothetical protein